MPIPTALIVPSLNFIISLLEQGPNLMKSISELLDNSDMSEFDKSELKMRIKNAQDKWGEWI